MYVVCTHKYHLLESLIRKQGGFIGGSERTILLCKPNKSMFESSASVGIHCLHCRVLYFVTVFNLVISDQSHGELLNIEICAGFGLVLSCFWT